jgi:4'-phosphopantetheinyl transferase
VHSPAPLLRVRSATVRPAVALGPALTADERTRVDRAAPADRDAVASAVLLARRAVAEACGVQPGAVRLRRRCPRCGSTGHGAPWAERSDDGPVPRLSMSRTTDLVVVALAGFPVGVDVERAGGADDALADETLAGVALAEGEQPAAGPDGVLRSWVRKEAVLKATGTGLSVDPRALRVSDAAGHPLVTAAGPVAPPDGARWWLTDLDLGAGHVAALAAALAPGVAPALDARAG